ncbi:universal stress protein [Streptomyces cinereoruber]|uniref:universal stress protein n=1 Tax=Streptomyces cinereoruber TaxID=67260 RepID=UPI003C2DD9BA
MAAAREAGLLVLGSRARRGGRLPRRIGRHDGRGPGRGARRPGEGARRRRSGRARRGRPRSEAALRRGAVVRVRGGGAAPDLRARPVRTAASRPRVAGPSGRAGRPARPEGPEVAASLDEALEPWRAAYPEVAAEGRVVIGSAGQEVVRAAADASLVVVGRRARRSAPGAHIGGVAYAVLHHGRAPVALVPHG